jgi:hypothetical protein
VRSLCVLLVLSIVGCGSAGGKYAESSRQGGLVDRGEVNGRMFDFISNKPELDDWQIRIRGNSMWVSYAKEEKSDDLGTTNLTDKEANKVWKLIDNLDLETRKQGKKDEDEGYVELRLREPSGDKDHDLITRFVTRATDDEDVLALAEYLQVLVEKYHKEKPSF